MEYHQGIRAEIDARDKSFAACIELGKKLLQRKHRESPEVGGSPLGWGDSGKEPPPDSHPLQIKAKLMELLDKRKAMMEMWQHRWDRLRLRECSDGVWVGCGVFGVPPTGC